MSKAYSQDLREKVMKRILSKELSKMEASRLFSIDVRMIRRWAARYRDTGSYQRKPSTHRPRSISDLDAFAEYVLSHPDQTQEEMAEVFGVCQSTLSETLKRAKISYKKNVPLSRKERGSTN